jgi:hypothetical protein
MRMSTSASASTVSFMPAFPTTRIRRWHMLMHAGSRGKEIGDVCAHSREDCVGGVMEAGPCHGPRGK